MSFAVENAGSMQNRDSARRDGGESALILASQKENVAVRCEIASLVGTS
jgi:hypothetical protein